MKIHCTEYYPVTVWTLFQKTCLVFERACCCLDSGLSPARCWAPFKPFNTTTGRERDSVWSRSSQYLAGLSLKLIYNKWLHSGVWNQQVKHTLKITVAREKQAYLQECFMKIFVLNSLICSIPTYLPYESKDLGSVLVKVKLSSQGRNNLKLQSKTLR